MSAFGDYIKDNVVDAIVELAESEKQKGKTTREIIQSINEVMTYGVDTVLFKLLEEGN